MPLDLGPGKQQRLRARLKYVSGGWKDSEKLTGGWRKDDKH